ncbi:MAG TPA: hypothetical protein VGL40_11110 [Bacillota bacterium]|jgi:hypothetical protein
MGGGLKEFVSYEEACVLLNLTPRVFRSILADFETEIVSVQAGLDVPAKHLTVGAYERLQRIVEMRGGGSGDTDIKAALATMTAASAEAAASSRPAVIAFPTPTPVSEVPAVYDADLADLSLLMERVGQLVGHLEAMEAQQREERERLLNTLLRTQQEVQSLRYELTAQKSRRDRKKSFWARLWEF